MDVAAFKELGYLIGSKLISPREIETLIPEFTTSSGQRIFTSSGPLALPLVSSRMLDAVSTLSGVTAKPVRMIYFDKTAASNWSLGWHQDRTIAVQERIDIAGFGPWTKKQGVQHVEPPFDFIEKSITVRISIDESDAENGALEVIPRSHRLGKLSDSATNQIAGSGVAKLLKTEPGDVLFLSTPILHRSASSTSARSRRVIQIDYSWSNLPPPLEWAFQQ